MGIKRLATWKSGIDNYATVIEFNDGPTVAVLHSAIAALNEAQIKFLISGYLQDRLPPGDKLFVHLNDDHSLAIAIGKEEPSPWPEDVIWE